jgi:phage terminase large subunit
MEAEVIKLSEWMNLTEKQLTFWEAWKKYGFPGYGGAAGGGKSYLLRRGSVAMLIKIGLEYKVPDVKLALFCETYEALRDRHLSTWDISNKFGELGKNDREGLRFKLKPEFGGGQLSLRNLDDPNKYDSAEFAGIAVDEFTKNPFSIFHDLRKRLRWRTIAEEPHLPCGGRVANRKGQVIDCPNEMHHRVPKWHYPFANGTNPGGISHGEYKRLWIQQDFPPELEPIKGEFAFVQAKSSDNPFNPPDYYSKNLATLPEHLRRAYAEGDWDIFAGQFFQEWRRELHVIKPFDIPPYWYRFRAMDWGYNAPASIGWYAKSPDNRVFKYREIYVREKTVKQLAGLIREAELSERIDYGVLDPSCWDASRGVSIAEQFQQEGIVWLKADNDRIGGWQRVREFLAWKRDPNGVVLQQPTLQVFDTCINTIRTLPAVVFDEHRVDDVDSDGEDHAADETRYALMSRPGLTIVPREMLSLDDQEAWDRAVHEENQLTRTQ